MTQLVELQRHVGEFAAAGFAVYAISYDRRDALSRFADRYGITYNLLSDEGSAVIRRFGILNTIIDPRDPRAQAFYGIPYPGVYVVNEQGVVTEKFFNRHYATRTSVGTILDTALGRVLARTESPAADARTNQVRVQAFLADRTLTLETTTTLHVRLQVAAGLHVYGAPLPEGFFPTTVTVRPVQGLRVGTPVFPRTTPRRFEALRVTLPVYEGVVDVRIPVTRSAPLEQLASTRSRFGFTGPPTIDVPVVVDYQACSETICYRPGSARLTVKVPMGDLVFPRP